jgi:hypothetical protein
MPKKREKEVRESMIPSALMERRRRAAISLFIAATFGMAAILSLPVVQLLPFPFRAPAGVEALGPPGLPEVPITGEAAPALGPGSLGRRRGRPVEIAPVRGVHDSGSDQRSGDGGDDAAEEITATTEPKPSVIHKDKVPAPPSTHEDVSDDKTLSSDESELLQPDPDK